MCAESGGHEEPVDFALAQNEFAIGCKGLGPVDELVHVGVFHAGHQRLCGLGERQEAVPVGGEQRVVEGGWDVSVETPRIGIALVTAHDHSAHFFAEVHQSIRVAHCW